MRRFAAPALVVLTTGLLAGAARADAPPGTLPRAALPAVTPPAAPPIRTTWAPPPLQVNDLTRLAVLPPSAYAPAGPARKPLPVPDRHSTGAMVTGIIVVSVGVLSLGIGTALGVASRRRCGGDVIDPPSPGGPIEATSAQDDACAAGSGGAAGMGFLVASAMFAGIGIPLWVFGSQRPSRYPDTAFAPTTPRLVVGPAAAGLRLAF